MEKDFERVDYSLNYYITRSCKHDCQGCHTNLDIYRTILDADHEDAQWMVVRCGRCEMVSLIDLPKYEGS